MDLTSEDNAISFVPVVDLDDDSHPPSNAVVSLLDDDDDLQIVETSIRHRPFAPLSFYLADDADIQVVESANATDEVQTVSVVKTPRAPTTCAACSSDLSDDTFTVSRCKHALCVPCAIRCVAVLYPNQRTSDETLSSNFDVRHLKRDPMCIVKRCHAPLSPVDSDLALAPFSTDQFFTLALSEFKHWKTDDISDNVGPSHIVFPDFTAEMAAEALRVDGDVGEGELFVDDFVGAFDPLWLWDGDYETGTGSTGAWMCAACGMYHHGPSAPASMGGADSTIFDLSTLDSETAIPDHPLYPHCHKARAFGFMESIRRLSKVEQENEPGKATTSKPATRTSTRRGRGKRYKTARSVQASKRRRVTGFAKGTGYAGRVGAEWRGTSTKILEKTARVDAATAFWLSRIRCFILRTKDIPTETWPGYMRLLLRECKLTEHLAKILINESIMDVGERVPVFVAALRVATALCDSSSLRRLVGEPNDGNGGRSVASLINSLSKQAALLTTGVGNENMCPKTKMLIKQIRKAIRGVNRYNLLRDTQHPNNTHPLANARSNTATLEKAGPSGDGADVQNGHEGTSEDEGKCSAEKMKQRYIAAMKGLQFETVQGLANASSFRNEIGKASASEVGRGQSLRRIASEVATLFSSLPLSWSSTILLRVDEDRYDFLRACVFGPEDTPYECGAFLFDIFLPSNYPQSPPKFKLLTTGGGRVRFNPNLYANGKVCLSLLGTWSGPSWTPASTLLQVLVSIQSLIMVPDPYFNEPGLERTMGTASGTRQSASYNQRVRTDTANVAILDALRNPYNEFRVAIQTHFRLKRGAVEHILRKWFNFRVEEIEPKKDEVTLPTSQPIPEPTVSTSQSMFPVNTMLSNIFGGTPAIPGTSSLFAVPGSAILPAEFAVSTVGELEALTSAHSSLPVTQGNVPAPQTGSSNLLSLASHIPGMLFGHDHGGSAPQTGPGLADDELPSGLHSAMHRPVGPSVDTDNVARSIIAELDKL